MVKESKAPISPNQLDAILLDLAAKIATEPEADTLYKNILDNAVALTGAEGGTIYFYDEADEMLVFKYVRSSDKKVEKALTGLKIKKGEGVVGRVAETLKPEVVDRASRAAKFRSDFDHLSGFHTESMLTVPVQFYDYGVNARTLVGVLQLVNKHDGPFEQEDVKKVEAFGGFAASLLTKAKLHERLRRQYLGTVASLAEAVDAKDRYTHGHSLRVSAYSTALGQAINLPPERLFNLRVSALLHDIGKIGIPDRILHKRKRLSDREFERIKTHVAEGVRILRPAGMPRDVYEGICYHHEHWDGTGYPEQLAGEAIPLFGRIIAFADAFDTITTKRTYKPALPFEEGRAIVRRDAGSHFDPVLARQFCDLPLDEVARQGIDIFRPLVGI